MASTSRAAALRRLAVLSLLLLAAALPSTARAEPGLGWAQLTCVSQLDTRSESENQVPSCQRGAALLGASAVAVSRDGRNVYVAAAGAGAVATFARTKSGAIAGLGCTSNNGTNGLDGTKRACADGDSLRGAAALALSPDGKNVYAAAYGSGGIAVFSRDPVTGKLKQTGCVRGVSTCVGARGLSGASGIVVSPDGQNVYLASYDADAVVSFARDPVTGALKGLGCISDDGTDRQCASGNALRGASALTMSADGRWLYVAAAASNAVLTFQRDPATGTLTQRGCVLDHAPANGSCSSAKALEAPYSLALAPDGRTLFVASYDSDAIDVFARDQVTGKLTQRGCLSDVSYSEAKDGCVHASPLFSPTALAVSNDGKRIFVTTDGGLAVLQRDPTSGGLEYLGCATYANYGEEVTKKCLVGRALAGATGVAVSPDGRNVYIAATESNAISVFTPAASVAVNRALNRVHALGVRVSCPATETDACAGVVTLTRRPDSARMAAPRSFRLAPGGSTTVYLRPRASVLAALAQHRPVRLMVATLDRAHCPSPILERVRLGPPPHPGLRARRT